MRSIRAAAVAALVLLDVSVAAAQTTRGFKDSWFWGVKGGGTFYQVMSDPDGSLSPLVGMDWMITRKRGGLYVSFDQTITQDIDGTAKYVLVSDSISPLDTVPRQVLVGGLRRFSLVGTIFPMQSAFMQPYVGLGVAIHHLARADAVGTYRNSTQENLVLSTIQRFRSSASPLFLLGSQFKLPLISVFGQVTATAADRNFFLFTGSGWRTTVEGGVRYNLGSSIERMR